MKLTLGFSPCPNDTFIFDALVNKKIAAEGIDFEVIMEDVQTLNQWALEGRLDVTKISYGVLPLILNDYQVLNSGGALGKGVGPLLISNKALAAINKPLEELTVAIPGENTTAHLLFSLAYPTVTKKRFMVFNEIEQAVLEEKVDAGVIIHENRFTYAKKGLKNWMDLGDYWEQKTGAPIPLGGIVAKRDLPDELKLKLNSLIKESVEFAFAQYPKLGNFIKENAQEMSEDVMRKHIDLYVNNFSIDLGAEGKKAVETLLEVYKAVHTGSNNFTGKVFTD